MIYVRALNLRKILFETATEEDVHQGRMKVKVIVDE